jgi:hypothetical protein
MKPTNLKPLRSTIVCAGARAALAGKLLKAMGHVYNAGGFKLG